MSVSVPIVTLLVAMTTASANHNSHQNFGEVRSDLANNTAPFNLYKLQDRNMATDEILRQQQLLSGSEMMDWSRQLFGQKTTDKCPPGAQGLQCQRQSALRGADECADGGMCVMCRQCHLLTPISWPVCCKNHFHCCRTIARACQRCDIPELWSFCSRTFGRCVYQPQRK